MKTALVFLVAAILSLLLLWSKIHFAVGDTTIDIGVHDTYYVIDRWQFVLVIILFLGTFFSLGGIIGTKLQNKFFLAALIVFTSADTYMIWKVWSSFNTVQFEVIFLCKF